jgi:hypothetical protein
MRDEKAESKKQTQNKKGQIRAQGIPERRAKHLHKLDWPTALGTNVICFPVSASFDRFQKVANDGRSPSASC